MSDSETSSDVRIDMYDSKGKINNSNRSEQKKSSDTDYYNNLLANDNKILADKRDETESSDLINSDSSSSSSKKTSSISSKSSKSSKTSRKSEEKNKFYDNAAFTPKPSSYDTPSKPRHSSSSKPSNPVVVAMTPQEVRMKKIELLRKLSEIKTKGFSLTKDYDFNSSIEEMEYEYELLKSFVDKRNGIKVYKNLLLNGVSIVEFLNDKYDPFDFHLEGWGEHMSVEVDSYDDVLEELYEKYKGTGKKMAPELKLVFLIIASASAFHFTKSQSTIPGIESVLKNNPELISRLINPKKQESQFMSQQEMNIQKQREIMQQRERELKQVQQTQQRQVNFMNTPNMPGPRQTVSEPVAANSSMNNVSQGGRPVEIRASSNVQDILNRIKQAQASAGQTDTQDESSTNNDRILSDANVSDSKRGRKPKAAPSISISTN